MRDGARPAADEVDGEADDTVAGIALDAGRNGERYSRWSAALEAKDLDGLVADYADDAVLFDAIPPFNPMNSKAWMIRDPNTVDTPDYSAAGGT